MKIASRWGTLLQTTLVFSSLMNACVAKTQTSSNVARLQEEGSVKRFLQTLDDDKTTQYIAAFRDLNGDGIPEAIVYFMGKKWCGSGGCTTLILARNDSSWKIVTRITITRPPIRILASKSHGWHSIAVGVQGGGIRPGYEAELVFNGRSYPRNPSVLPSHRLKGSPAGEVVIPSEGKGTPLYQN